jgi:dihydroorotase
MNSSGLPEPALGAAGEYPVAITDRAPRGEAEGAADDYRRMRLLRRLGPGHHRRKADELAVMFRLVLGPDLLHRRDLLAHLPFPNAPVKEDGQIREEVLEARRRGVIFDIGHGSGSFGFRTAEAMLTAGFLPDVISSDVHALSIKGPAFDQLVTMSKFLCLGMELADAIRASTAAPAAALGRTDIGRLEVGAIGDATVLELAEGDFEYRDVLGEVRAGRQRLKARGVVLAGSWWHPPRA